ncbi:unnamed protein product [Cuscuta epithymum]|uniref:Uncharacterized protein n=1 Tax=Cuscuta epithymum TaxID=186058 RepID=A0AAV0E0P6_9ASTE|nr:unnamed protein product [Cuscuta epithymum]
MGGDNHWDFKVSHAGINKLQWLGALDLGMWWRLLGEGPMVIQRLVKGLGLGWGLIWGAVEAMGWGWWGSLGWEWLAGGEGQGQWRLVTGSHHRFTDRSLAVVDGGRQCGLAVVAARGGYRWSLFDPICVTDTRG